VGAVGETDEAAPPWRETRFMLGAVRAKQFPTDEGWEVAVAGRSNAGKSSALNLITGRRGLARVSKTPGRTREINFFELGPRRRLVDLPGYGYARVPAPIKQAWQRLMEAYFRGRRSLRGVVVVMDCRHPLTDYDQQMLHWCAHSGLPVHVLLTKADKLSRGAAMAVLHQVRGRLGRLYKQDVSAQLFSALSGDGVEAAREILSGWLSDRQKKAPV
jgi:GTP-binding protein